MKKLLMYLPILLIIAFVGCNIITGNILIVIDLDDQTVTGESSGFESWPVDREDFSDWKDHADDLNHVVDLGFATQIINNGNSEATARFWVSENPYADVASVEANATLVLNTITIPAGATKKITWSESYDYIENFDTLKELIMKGKFWLYATAVSSNVNVTFHKNAIILTINAKP